MSDGQQQQQQQQRPSSLFSLLRLAQPNFREFLINSNLFGENSTDFNDMITHSILTNNFSPQSPPSVNEGILGECTFFSNHSRFVKGVDFSPRDDHIFCSTGLDGKLIIYDARFAKVKSTTPINFQGTISFSGLKFLHDGFRIALTTTSNKLLIYDIEKGIVVQNVDKCCSSVHSRTSIAVDPDTGIIMTPNLTGNGLSQIDIRTSSIVKSLDHLHTHQINDIEILDRQWSDFYRQQQQLQPTYNQHLQQNNNNIENLIMTVSSDTNCKIFDNQKNQIKEISSRSPLYSIQHTPEVPSQSTSCLAIGGEKLGFYSIDGTLEQTFSCKGIVKLKYTKSGTKLFSAGNDGYVRLFSRFKRKHELQGVVYRHSRDIQDMAMSRNDEYLVTASTDNKIGLIRIGDPIFGPSEYGNII
ncbi:hypothetical protein DLAC_10898 [Tieghemostelium lacteum]|uniref:WD40 repeat-containing protein n=1 Tax=Tieghemostelium lacteum TaxID=361077 RepID=A0A151Z2L8_TIELA|nr:hypothetical protein DLAC_10898 [Tieghemostelium lacteum]|eukprot:KYQ88212.1 hypothetical protein DLAC_10898 [Tieghemostelium lacteum]